MRIPTFVLGIGILSLVLGGVSAEQRAQVRSQAEKLFARATADDFVGDEACASCHAEKAEAFAGSIHAAHMVDPKAPIDKRGCEGCHGPGGIHQAEENPEVLAFRTMDAKESAAACLRCHAQTLSETHWKRSAHAKADLSCVSCHQIHPDSAPNWAKGSIKKGDAEDPRRPVYVARVESKSLLMADEAVLCGQCHAPQLAQFKLPSHHPVPEGKMVCSDCHSVHPSRNEKARTPGEKGTCVTCHREVAGPFAYEHEPVQGHTGEGCAECHKPHGSVHDKMLNSGLRGLCGQCHTEKIARHYPGQTCWTSGCHVAPHGSNSSPRLLRP